MRYSLLKNHSNYKDNLACICLHDDWIIDILDNLGPPVCKSLSFFNQKVLSSKNAANIYVRRYIHVDICQIPRGNPLSLIRLTLILGKNEKKSEQRTKAMLSETMYVFNMAQNQLESDNFLFLKIKCIINQCRHYKHCEDVNSHSLTI